MKRIDGIALFIAAMIPLSFAAQMGLGGANNQLEAKRAAWRSWRANHPNVLSLQHTVLTLARLQEDPMLKLNSKQASLILDIFAKKSEQTKLTDKQAKVIDVEIESGL